MDTPLSLIVVILCIIIVATGLCAYRVYGAGGGRCCPSDCPCRCAGRRPGSRVCKCNPCRCSSFRSYDNPREN